MSLYRVSTANTYDRALFNIQQRQQSMGVSQEQLSSGKRVGKASDDTVAAVLSERTLGRQARTQADLRALEASRRSLSQAESSLGTAADLYARFKELTVQAGGGIINGADKKSIAAELRGIREQLVDLANQKDTAGNPLFGGLGSVSPTGQPFSEQVSTALTTTYGPDGRSVNWDALRGQVAPTETTLPNSIDGYNVFKGVRADPPAAVVAQTAGGFEAVSVSVTTANPDVFDHSPDALSGTQGSYTLAYTAAAPGPGTWQVTQTNRTNTPLPVAAAPAPFAVVPVQVGDSLAFSFDGMTVTLEGDTAALAANASFTVTPAVDRDIWETLDRAIGALEQGETGRDLAQELGVVHTQLALRQDQLLSVRGKLGEWLNRADNLATLFGDRSVAYEKENSELTDVDMVKAVTDFEMNQTAYQAALQSYAQVQKMSMFDYLR
jgi:flagellar hook-associated protein 3 FlgL